MVDHKQTMNCKLQDSDLFFNLLDETDNQMKKIKEKIIVQKAEILKTKSMMDLFEECLMKQNEMLTRLTEDEKVLHEKKELLLAIRDLDSDDDMKLVQTNCDDLEIGNCSDLITYKALKNDVKRANTIDCEYDNKRKKLSTDLCLFNDSKISKQLNPKFILLKEKMQVVNKIINYGQCNYICGNNGLIMKYPIQEANCAKSIKTGHVDNINNMMIIGEVLIVISGDSLKCYYHLNIYDMINSKQFNATILDINKQSQMIMIPLANGEVWIYNYKHNSFHKDSTINSYLIALVPFSEGYVYLQQDGCLFASRTHNIQQLYDLQGCIDIGKGPQNTFIVKFTDRLEIIDHNSHRIIQKIGLVHPSRFIKFYNSTIIILDTENHLLVYRESRLKKRYLDIDQTIDLPKSSDITTIFVNNNREVEIATKGRIIRITI